MQRMLPLRIWIPIHRWTSLICTLFLLVLCVTGLPLIFFDEIRNTWIRPPIEYAELPGVPPLSIDRIIERARDAYPNQIVTGVGISNSDPHVRVTMAPSWTKLKADPKLSHFINFDSRTAEILAGSKPSEQHMSWLGVVDTVHQNMLAGLPGEMFLAVMALLFLVAIVSGIVLYGPFSRKLDFGALRVDRSARVRWLDVHNLLGVVTIAWALVVGATGLMNTLSIPLFDLWRQHDLAAAIQPWRGKPAVSEDHLSSVQAALDTVKAALPGMEVTGVVFPGSPFGSPNHYLIWTRGNSPLTAQLFSPVLVDAETGKLTKVVRMPWYLRTLEVSRPLHFGDYGGLPLKIIWTLLDLVTIVVLGSGVYLWLSRRKSPIEARIADLELVEAASEPSTVQVVAE